MHGIFGQSLAEAALKSLQVLLAWAVMLIALGMWRPAVLAISQVWFLCAMSIAANVLQPSYKLSEGSRNQHDRGTARQIVWSVYGSQILALIELGTFGREAIAWDGFSLIAASLMLAGLGLRTWAIHTLGRYFTWNIDVQEEQSVITTGPYRFIRHPSYSGAWITYVASCLLLRSWCAAVCAIIALSLAFRRRVHYEEAILRTRIPAYEQYMSSTPAFIPRWSRHMRKSDFL